MGKRSYRARGTVEACQSISTKFLKDYFDDDVRIGYLSWNQFGKEIGRIAFRTSTIEGDEHIRFFYSLTNNMNGEVEALNYQARLASTSCHYGGRRWWFICPLVTSGCACGRRVGVLYLGSKYFGCRHCYNLTYASCQQSHKFDRMYAKIAQELELTADQVKLLMKP